MKKEAKVLVLNLMPEKQKTQDQYERVFSFLNLEFILIDELFDKISQNEIGEYDAFIVSGTPLEKLAFEEVSYWQKITTVFDWARANIKSTLFICWGSQAALYYYYGVQKKVLNKKLFGVFPEKYESTELFSDLNSSLYIPHSRNAQSNYEEIKAIGNLNILSYSSKTGASIVEAKDKSQLFFNGHLEYDETTLLEEYLRDINNDVKTDLPCNYFYSDNPDEAIIGQWLHYRDGIFKNWFKSYILE